jgi:8-oxo-dGTP diphosphatase
MIEVSCAIIIDGSKILTVQRGEGSSNPLKWEFPGGKIHWGETPGQCVFREIEEELRVRVDVLLQLEHVEFYYGTKLIRLIPFICKITSGELILTEHIAKCWFDLDEWQTIDWSGADYELILKNQEGIKTEIDILTNSGNTSKIISPNEEK